MSAKKILFTEHNDFIPPLAVETWGPSGFSLLSHMLANFSVSWHWNPYTFWLQYVTVYQHNRMCYSLLITSSVFLHFPKSLCLNMAKKRKRKWSLMASLFNTCTQGWPTGQNPNRNPWPSSCPGRRVQKKRPSSWLHRQNGPTIVPSKIKNWRGNNFPPTHSFPSSLDSSETKLKLNLVLELN